MDFMRKLTFKNILLASAGGIVLCAVMTVSGWLFVTSSFAVCKLWLPLAGKLTGQGISASEAAISPLRGHFEIKGLKLVSDTSSVKIDSLSLDAAPFKALFGGYEIKTLKVSGAAVSLKLQPKAKAKAAPAAAPAPAKTYSKASAPVPAPVKAPRILNLKTGQLKIESSSLHIEFPSEGKLAWLSVNDLYASCDGLEKGVESHLAVSCAIAGDDCRELSLASSSLSVTATYLPDAAFIPKGLSLQGVLSVVSAKLDSADISGSALELLCSLKDGGSKVSVEKLTLAESVKGQPKSSVALSGTVGKEPLSLDLGLDVKMRSSPLLDYLIDFAVDCDLSHAELDYAAKFKGESGRYTASGGASLKGARFLPHSNGSLGALGDVDLEMNHDLTADIEASTLDVKTFNLGVSGAGRKVVSISSLRPFSYCWERGRPLWPHDATPELSAKIDALPLSFLNAFLKGASFASGTLDLSGSVKAGSAASGKQVSAALKLYARQLALAKADGSPLLEPSDFSGGIVADAMADGSLALSSFDLECAEDGVGVARVSLKGSFNPGDGLGGVKGSVSILNYKALDLLRLTPESALKFKSAAKSLQPFELSLDTEAAVALKSSEASLKTADLVFASKRFGRVSVALAGPLSANWGGKGFALSKAKFRAQSADLDLSLINSFKGQGGSKLRGLCNALFDGAFDLQEGAGSLKGSVNLDCVPVDLPGKDDDQMRLAGNVDASLFGWSQVKVASLKLKAIDSDGEGVGLEAGLSANYDIKAAKGSVELGSFHSDGADLIKILGMASAPDSVRKFAVAVSPMDLNVKGAASFSLPESKAALNALDAGLLGKGGQFISLSCEQPFQVCWAKDAKGGLQEGQAKFRVGARNAGLQALGVFAPASAVAFNAGNLNADFSVAMAGLWREFQVDGEISSDGLDAVIAGSRYNGVDPYLKGSLKLDDFARKLSIPSMDFGAKVAKIERLSCQAKGALDFSGGSTSGRMGVQIARIDNHFLSRLPFAFTQGVESLDASGRFVWGPSAKAGTPSNFLCEFKIAKFSSLNVKESSGRPVEFSGSIASELDYSKELLAFRQCSLDVSSSGRQLAVLGVTGQLRGNGAKGPSAVSITSSALDIKALQALFSAPPVKKGKASAAEAPEGWEGADAPKAKPVDRKAASAPSAAQVEPAPVDLKGFNGNVSFDLKNVSYGPELNASLVGRVIAQGGTLGTDGLLLTVNGSPAKLVGGIDLSKVDGYEYNFDLSCQYMDLGPIAKAFGSNCKGELREFRLPVSGKGITKRNLAKHLSSDLKCRFSKLSIPYEMDAPMVVRIVFLLPVEAVAKLDQFFVGNQLDLSPLKRSFEDIKKNGRTIQFQNGEVVIAAHGGVATVSKLSFTGGDPIDSIDVTGTETISTGVLNFYSKAHAMRTIMPIRIVGTLEKPEVEYSSLAVDFTKENTLNILNPANITDGTAGDLTKKALDIGRKIEGFLGR